MNIEQAQKISVTEIQKQLFSSGTNFKEKLPTYLKEINLNTSIQEENQPKDPTSIEKSIKFEGQKNKLKSQISTIIQTGNKLYLFLGRNSIENYSEITIYEYEKSDGSHKSMELAGIRGQIMSMKAKFSFKRNKPIKKNQNQKSSKKSQSGKGSQQNIYEIILLIGTKSGYLKSIRFNDITVSMDQRTTIESIKLDFTSILDLIMLDSSYFFGANICLALSQTNKVYLVNFDYMVLLTLFMPTIMSCEVGLSLSVNYQRQYFIQSSEGGYILFWDLDDHIRRLIKDSMTFRQKQPEKTQKSTREKIQNNEQNEKPAKALVFKSSSIHHNISPISIFHSATITGLKFCQLYGNLIMLITQGGLIKLIAVNSSQSLDQMNKNQYCSLLEYQVQDGELISDAKFFPDTKELFVVKNVWLEGMMMKSGEERYIQVRQFDVEKLIESKKNKGKVATSFPYKPNVIRENKRGLIIPQRSRSKSMDDRKNRSYFERIIFNSELQIQQVDKIYQNYNMNCIDSLQMTGSKDILILRGKEYYLIGTTELFKPIDLS